MGEKLQRAPRAASSRRCRYLSLVLWTAPKPAGGRRGYERNLQPAGVIALRCSPMRKKHRSLARVRLVWVLAGVTSPLEKALAGDWVAHWAPLPHTELFTRLIARVIVRAFLGWAVLLLGRWPHVIDSGEDGM
jgi:hypothetical protein